MLFNDIIIGISISDNPSRNIEKNPSRSFWNFSIQPVDKSIRTPPNLCTKCDIHSVSAKLGSKKVIGIFKYLKYILFAITLVKTFEI